VRADGRGAARPRAPQKVEKQTPQRRYSAPKYPKKALSQKPIAPCAQRTQQLHTGWCHVIDTLGCGYCDDISLRASGTPTNG